MLKKLLIIVVCLISQYLSLNAQEIDSLKFPSSDRYQMWVTACDSGYTKAVYLLDKEKGVIWVYKPVNDWTVTKFSWTQLPPLPSQEY